MPEKFKVSYQGKVNWEGMAKSENEAKAFARVDVKELKDVPPEELTAEVVPFDLANSPGEITPEPIITKAKQPGEKKGRKPRADRGKPRGGTQTKKEPKKRRTTYHLVTGEVISFDSKNALDAALKEEDILDNIQVIIGGTLRSVECQKRFILK